MGQFLKCIDTCKGIVITDKAAYDVHIDIVYVTASGLTISLELGKDNPLASYEGFEVEINANEDLFYINEV